MTDILSQEEILAYAEEEHDRTANQSDPVYIIGEDVEITNESEIEEIPTSDVLFLILLCILSLMTGIIGVAYLATHGFLN